MRHTATHRRPVALVGPMGSGKSHVGRLLATRLNLDFIDLDARIADTAGMTIPYIFEREGEAGFRARERAALADALARERVVIATGGGAVIDAANRAALRAAATVAYLRVGADEQLRRLAGDTERPLLAGADRAQRLAGLQAEREPLYREVAEFALDTDARTPDQIADALAERLGAREDA